jgi:hypothetical protein
MNVVREGVLLLFKTRCEKVNEDAEKKGSQN